jgi:GTPase
MTQSGFWVIGGNKGILRILSCTDVSEETKRLCVGAEGCVLLCQVESGTIEDGDDVVISCGDQGRLDDIVARLEARGIPLDVAQTGERLNVILMTNSLQKLRELGIPAA